ncbi:hypothetical protein SLEP1_g60139 [Rubroshorea leprosula]|uniref:Uncharacterized protein n=1 Tax=Rubroshorea leprosula TaxID=152421 RepID=A0AAV5MUW6_9ROSI|nr:hypothetical protein SLEP1_g60139 [Rubroshorea leprosula]
MGFGGNNRQKKPSFSLASLFKPRQVHRVDDSWAEEPVSGRRVWPSDEDKRYQWVAEPGIDRKASVFIANFHATRISESLSCQAPHENAST